MSTEIYALRQTITEYQRDLRDLNASHFELIDAEHRLQNEVRALRAQVAALQAELAAARSTISAVQGSDEG